LNADANVGGLVGINDNFTVGSADGLNAVAGFLDGLGVGRAENNF